MDTRLVCPDLVTDCTAPRLPPFFSGILLGLTKRVVPLTEEPDGVGEVRGLLLSHVQNRLVSHLLNVPPATRLTYAEAFTTFAKVDPHRASLEELAKIAQVPIGDEPPSRDELLDRILVELVEPNLGKSHPTILHDYPASQAALAQVRPGEVPVAERFEIYVEGIELANGYHELLDADVLRQRNAQANKQRVESGGSELPEPKGLLAAMDAGLPACCGVALGFDRLVMLSVGAKSIAEVMSFTTGEV
jgi:lysyl-tRNA synthetase class 2